MSPGRPREGHHAASSDAIFATGEDRSQGVEQESSPAPP